MWPSVVKPRPLRAPASACLYAVSVLQVWALWFTSCSDPGSASSAPTDPLDSVAAGDPRPLPVQQWAPAPVTVQIEAQRRAMQRQVRFRSRIDELGQGEPTGRGRGRGREMRRRRTASVGTLEGPLLCLTKLPPPPRVQRMPCPLPFGP